MQLMFNMSVNKNKHSTFDRSITIHKIQPACTPQHVGNEHYVSFPQNAGKATVKKEQHFTEYMPLSGDALTVYAQDRVHETKTGFEA